MSAPGATSPATVWQWPADVLAYAKEQRVDRYLAPLLDGIHRVFPSARRVKATLEFDPEIQNDRHIVFSVHVPREDVPNFVEALRRWNREEDRILPDPQTCVFRMCLELIS